MRKFLLLMGISLLAVSCSNSGGDVAGGVETGNGFTAGIVYSSEGIPQAKTIVALVPENFNPVTDTLVDSLTDTTDLLGNYGITSEPGVYNIYAKSSNEVALVREIQVDKEGTVDKEIILETPKAVTVPLEDTAATAGNLYFKGTLYSAEYESGEDSVQFTNMPETGALPALHRYEDGVDSELSYDIYLAQSELVKQTDGYSNFTRLLYDENRQILWLGTRYAGVFRYSFSGQTLGHEDQMLYPQFNHGVTALGFAADNEPLVGTGVGALKYNSASNEYLEIDTTIRDSVLSLSYDSEESWWILYSNALKTNDTTLLLQNITDGDESAERIFCGSTNGKIYVIDKNTYLTTVLPVTLPAIQQIKILSDGTLGVVTSDGLSFIRNGEEVSRLTRFSERNGEAIVAFKEDAEGVIYILTEFGGLYRLNRDSSFTAVIGFSDYFPISTKGEVWTYPSDFEFDIEGLLWLLNGDGSMIRLSFE